MGDIYGVYGIWVVNVHESSFKIVGAARVSQKKRSKINFPKQSWKR